VYFNVEANFARNGKRERVAEEFDEPRKAALDTVVIRSAFRPHPLPNQQIFRSQSGRIFDIGFQAVQSTLKVLVGTKRLEITFPCSIETLDRKPQRAYAVILCLTAPVLSATVGLVQGGSR
jgi:hypothetical protein